MLNILLDHGPRAPDCESYPSRKNMESMFMSQGNACMVSESNMHAAPEPHLSSSICVGGHGGCYVLPKENMVTHNLDWLTNKQKSPDKNKRNGVRLFDSDMVRTSQIQLGSFGTGFNVPQEGHFHEWESASFPAPRNYEKNTKLVTIAIHPSSKWIS